MSKDQRNRWSIDHGKAAKTTSRKASKKTTDLSASKGMFGEEETKAAE